MTFTLAVDGFRWREHQRATLEAVPGLVPVAKGNGYGVSNRRLAVEAARLGVDTLAVGIADEVRDVADPFPGHVLVLTPWDGEDDGLARSAGGRVLRTVAHRDVLERLAKDEPESGEPVVVELLTSMRRHGITVNDLPAVAALPAARRRGFALHLPLDRPSGVDPVGEVDRWIADLRTARLDPSTLWVSHLTPAELAALRQRHPGTTYRPRVGTALWLGDPGALQAAGTVLDVQPVSRGERYGYRQRRSPRDGSLVIVSGGTAHGVGLEAPKAPRGAVSRAKEVARGTLESAGLVLSPFSWAGRQRWFAEPPHMQVSMLWLPADVEPPQRGAQLPCQVRHTIVHPDRVVIS